MTNAAETQAVRYIISLDTVGEIAHYIFFLRSRGYAQLLALLESRLEAYLSSVTGQKSSIMEFRTAADCADALTATFATVKAKINL